MTLHDALADSLEQVAMDLIELQISGQGSTPEAEELEQRLAVLQEEVLA